MSRTLPGYSAGVDLPRNTGAGDRVVAEGKAPRLAFRPDIEGLRAVAVLLVVLSHVGLGTFAGGYVGVDVFFVISGFLITSLLLAELSRTGRISLVGFYTRRAIRLLPASTLVLVVTLVAAWWWAPPIRLSDIVGDAIASALYGINYRLAVQGTDYWNVEADPSPLQHYWSLAVEEQFYLIWPLLLLVCALGWWRGRRTVHTRSVVAVLVAVGLISFALSVSQTPHRASWAYFGLHTRAWELALGALVAVGASALSRTPARLAAALTWIGLGAVLWSAVTYSEATVFPGYAAALPVVGVALVIAGGCAAPRAGAQALLRLAPFQLVGKLSYGWYLWHWPVLMLGPAVLGIEPTGAANAALAAAALVLAAASYVLVEDPIRHRRSLRLAPRRGLALGAGLTATTVAAATLVVAFPPASTGTGQAPDTVALLAQSDDPEQDLRQLIAQSVPVRAVPRNLTPSLADVEDQELEINEDGCHLEFGEVESPDDCVYGDRDSDTTVVLFGDSHAAQWFPALEIAAEQERWRLLSLTKSACHAASVDLYNRRLERIYHECMRWRSDTLAEIREMDPDLVVMSSIDVGSSDLAGEHADPDQVWAQGWVESFERAAGPGTEEFLLLDTPRPGWHVPECLSEHLAEMTACVPAADQVTRVPTRRAVVAGEVDPEVTVVDPKPWFCTNQWCPVVIGNVLVYRDSNHITAAYAKLLAPLLARVLQAGDRY